MREFAESICKKLGLSPAQIASVHVTVRQRDVAAPAIAVDIPLRDSDVQVHKDGHWLYLRMGSDMGSTTEELKRGIYVRHDPVSGRITGFDLDLNVIGKGT